MELTKQTILLHHTESMRYYDPTSRVYCYPIDLADRWRWCRVVLGRY